MPSVNERLSAKLRSEMNEFIASMEGKTASEILDQHAYEYTFKNEFIIEIENGNVPEKVKSALLKDKTPLQSLYNEWLHNDYSYMDLVSETITDCGEKLIKDNRKKNAMTR